MSETNIVESGIIAAKLIKTYCACIGLRLLLKVYLNNNFSFI